MGRANSDGIGFKSANSKVPYTDELIKISSNDTTAGYLSTKAIGSTTITITETNDGSYETLVFTVSINGVTDLAAPAIGDELLISDIDDGNAVKKADVASVVNLADHDALTNFVAGEHTDAQVKCSSNDSTPGYLEDKLVSADSKLTVSTLNDGADEDVQLAVNEGNIVHDNLSGFVSNEHIDHSSVSIVAGSDDALSVSNNDLTSNIGLSVDITGVTAEASVDDADEVLIYDSTATALRKMTRANFTAGLVHNTGTPVDNQIAVWTAADTIEGDTALTFDTSTDTLTSVNAVLSGDLTVNGTTVTLNVTNLDVADTNITVNDGGNQASADDNAGITVEMSDATDAKIIYDKDATSRFRIGDSGSEIEVATISGSQVITNKTIDVDNNTVSNIEVDNFKTGVLDTDLSSVSASDDTIPSAKATKSLVDSSANPAGTLLAYASSSTPSGYLSCDGSAVNRTTYSALFTAIGTTWGVGDGSTTFNIPDLRGSFLRGTGSHGTANMADGNDFAGPSVGSFENDQFQGHWHEFYLTTSGGSGGGFYTVNDISTVKNDRVKDAITDGTNGTPRAGDETRPFNAGVHYIIKT